MSEASDSLMVSVALVFRGDCVGLAAELRRLGIRSDNTELLAMATCKFLC